jgi:disulfide bond formation protein DsbB
MRSAYRLLTRWWTAFALAISLALLGAAHAFERFGGLSPCNLCLKQREVLWGAVAISLVATIWTVISQARRGTPRIAAFLRHVLKLKVIVTTADAHDREVAMVQGLTHLIAKILVRMEPLPRTMTTASFDLLMQATEMVRYDAPNVFMAIERANPHAKAVRDRFFALAEEMRLFLEHGHTEATQPASALPHKVAEAAQA